jgi:hypothetical protein
LTGRQEASGRDRLSRWQGPAAHRHPEHRAQQDLAGYFADQFHKVLGWDVNVKVVERGTFIKAMNAGQVAFFLGMDRGFRRPRDLSAGRVL